MNVVLVEERPEVAASLEENSSVEAERPQRTWPAEMSESPKVVGFRDTPSVRLTHGKAIGLQDMAGRGDKIIVSATRS